MTPYPKKFKRVFSAVKVIASIVWDSYLDVIMVNYLEEGRKINNASYAGDLRRLRQEVAKKREKLTQSVLLLQDNAPAHTYQAAIATVTECSFEVHPHPPYSPDLAHSNFYLFPNLKTSLLEF